MILIEDAKRIAEKHLAAMEAGCGIAIAFNYDVTEEIESGFVFFYNTRQFWETGDPSFTLDGNEPIFVSKINGNVREITMEQFLEYEAGNKSGRNKKTK